MKHLKYLTIKSKIIVTVLFICVLFLLFIAGSIYRFGNMKNAEIKETDKLTQFEDYIVVKRVTEIDKEKSKTWEWRQDINTKKIGFYYNGERMEIINSTYLREEIAQLFIPKESVRSTLEEYKSKEIPILYTCNNDITFEYISYLQNNGWSMRRCIETEKQTEIYLSNDNTYLRFFLFRDGTMFDTLDENTKLTDITVELSIK